MLDLQPELEMREVMAAQTCWLGSTAASVRTFIFISTRLLSRRSQAVCLTAITPSSLSVLIRSSAASASPASRAPAVQILKH